MRSYLKPIGVFATLMAASLLFAPSAHAQPAANSWTGIYLGLHAGVADADVTLENAGGLHFYNNGTEYSLNPGSAGGGVQVEGMYQFNHFVVGGEIAATAGDFEDEIVAAGPFTATNTYNVDMSEIYTASVKLGYAPDSCSCLPYLRVGYAQADIETAATEAPIFAHSGGSDGTQEGWVYGVGYTQRVGGGRLAVGVDYQHIDFDSDTQDGFDSIAFATYAVDVDAEVDMFTGRLTWQLF
jgi:hypothetical protein